MADDEQEITLKFIEDYRSYPELWDHKNNKLYTNKVKRNDYLHILATKYNMDIDGVKRKIKSLRSYFSKEHHKVTKKNTVAGSSEIHQSPWFAYNHLLFIVDSVTPREHTCIEEVKDMQAEIINGDSCTTLQPTYMSEDEHDLTLPPSKKRHIATNVKEDEAYSFNHPTVEITQKDEFTIYGELIAHKIRRLNSLNRLLAQQRINNILFDLELGELNEAAATPNVLLTPKVEDESV